MQRTATMIHSPGCCALCSRSDRDVVDTKLDALANGRLYICVICVTLLARTAGLQLLDPAVLADLEQREAQLAAKTAALGEAIEQAESVGVEYDRLLRAVAHTLREGAVVRRGRIELRKPPGPGKAFDLPELTSYERGETTDEP